MPKYSVIRKYQLEVRGGNRFEILDLGAEDIESKEDILKTLKELDKVANEYCEQFVKPQETTQETSPEEKINQEIADLPK